MAWLPAEFIRPAWVPVGDGYHLRPITAADADLDYPAVMGSLPGPLPARASSAATCRGQTGSPCRTLIRPLLQRQSPDSAGFRRQRPHRALIGASQVEAGESGPALKGGVELGV
jgi:hypothetical protein